MALAEVDNALSGYEASYASRLQQWKRRAVEGIVEQIRLDSGESALQNGLRLPDTADLRSRLLGLRMKIASFGARQAEQEMARQKRAQANGQRQEVRTGDGQGS